MAEKFKYEFKLTPGQRTKIELAQAEMYKQYEKGILGGLILQIDENLKSANGYFLPNEIFNKVRDILIEWHEGVIK